ncbi:methyl-accepting chemotaxis sensory transducer with Pas/Pac sensor [Salinisphaera sp. C84B14]
MFKSEAACHKTALIKAIHRSMAVIEFDPQGKILCANSAFLETTGYDAESIIGQHHSLLCSREYAQSADYAAFWARLREGEFVNGRCERLTQAGERLWLEASYNPIHDRRGRVVRVIKIATDITAKVNEEQEVSRRLRAINRSMAVIEFTPSGQILTANDNFLATVGYTLMRSSVLIIASSAVASWPVAPSIAISGHDSTKASSWRGNSNATTTPAECCGWKPPTTRSLTKTANSTKSSNSPATSPSGSTAKAKAYAPPAVFPPTPKPKPAPASALSTTRCVKSAAWPIRSASPRTCSANWPGRRTPSRSSWKPFARLRRKPICFR